MLLIGTLGFDPEVAKWMTFREMDAAVRGYRDRERAEWARTLTVYNIVAGVTGNKTLSYEDLTGEGQAKPDVMDEEEWEALKARALKYGDSR